MPEIKENSSKSYALIPSYILDDESIDSGAQMLYARISMLANEGRCWETNNYFSEKQRVTIRCIQKWLKELSEAGYIEIEIIKTGSQTRRIISTIT